MRSAAAASLAAVACMLAGCGSSGERAGTAALPRALVAEARPVGRGARFQPPVRGQVTGRCTRRLGSRYGVHVELFAANRVVIVASGIGTVPPRVALSGRITEARCYGDIVTLEPTGLVLVRDGLRLRLAALFRAWGQPLSARRLGPFGGRVREFVAGRPRSGPPGAIALARHAVIVLQVGPYVPPHHAYRFPPGT